MFPVIAASHKKTPSYGRMRSCGIPGTLRFLAFFTVVASIQISPHIFRPSVRRLTNYSERQSRRDDGTAKLSEN